MPQSSTRGCCAAGRGQGVSLGLIPLPSPGADVIHAVGPIAQGEPSASQEKELENCYKNSLKLAVENKLRTVAFPCLSTGVFGYPSDAAAEVVLRTLREWLEENKEKVDRLVICVFQEKDEEIYKEKLPPSFPIGPVCANQAQATGAEQKAEAAEWSSGSAASEVGKIIPMSHSNPDGKLSPSPACIQDGIFLLDKPLRRARLWGGEHTASQGEMNFASEQLKDEGPALVSA
ncbi:MACRO domain-containing protein 1 [Chelonia mydas]|uniref:MACRO domain-containing protein 1 n=1 Tax=Chelonia mydas TaxID=8469 RepID=M7BC48_CHEMY|nr:MACRO domain-containing protein 1 [Chelonia mydas]